VPCGQRRDHVEQIGRPRRGALNRPDLHLDRAILEVVDRPIKLDDSAAKAPASNRSTLHDPDELATLRSQSGISRAAHGGRRFPPYAFTEHGVAMLSSVLRSQRAVHVNIEIVRAFVRLRSMLATDSHLARKLTALEKNYDAKFRVVFDAIRQLMAPPDKPRRRIGFHA